MDIASLNFSGQYRGDKPLRRPPKKSRRSSSEGIHDLIEFSREEFLDKKTSLEAEIVLNRIWRLPELRQERMRAVAQKAQKGWYFSRKGLQSMTNSLGNSFFFRNSV